MTKSKYTKYESINHLTESLKLVLSEDFVEPRSNANPQYYKNAPREMLNSFIITIAYRLTAVNNKIHGTATQKSLKEQKKFIDNNGVDSDVQLQRKDDIAHDCKEYDHNQMILSEMHQALSKLYVELYNADHVMPAPKPAQTNLRAYAQQLANTNAGRIAAGEESLTRAEMDAAIQEMANTLSNNTI